VFQAVRALVERSPVDARFLRVRLAGDVGDAVRGVLVPGDAPQPLPAVEDALRARPLRAVLREADEGVMVLDRIARRGNGSAADEQEATIRRDREVRVAQIDAGLLDARCRLPLRAGRGGQDADGAGALGVAGAFAEDAVPAAVVMEQVGEGVVRRLVPDFADL